MAQAAKGYNVDVEQVPALVPLGASLPIQFTLKNESESELPLEMDYMGKPAGLMRVVNEQGEDLKPEGPGIEAAGFQKDEVYLLKPEEQIKFQYDLAVLYSFKRSRAGKHTLQFTTEEGVVARQMFEVVDYHTLTSREVTGTYDAPVRLAESYGVPASVRLSVVRSENPEASHWLLVDQIKTSDVLRSQLPSYACAVDETSSIERAEMDYRGQVWVSVKSGRNRSLLVWRLQDLSWSVLIASTESRIELSKIKAKASVPNQYIVIAGMEGKEKFTTQSVWAMPRHQR